MASRKLEVQIIGDSRSVERAFGRSSLAGKKFSNSLTGVTSGIRRSSLAITAAGAAIIGFGGASVRSAARFEESMQKIVGLSGVAQGKIEGLSDAVLGLAPEVGKGPQELAEALLFITSSGIPAARAMDVLTQSAKASAAGLGDTATVADAVTSAMNAYGQAHLNAKQATDVLVATVREGKGEASEFAGVIGNVTAIASQLGVSFNDVGSALASMTRLGTDAETSATQLQQVFSNLVKVTPQQEKAFKAVGLSAAGLRKTIAGRGLLAGLKQIKNAFKGDLPGLAKAFGDIRALRGVLALVGNQAKTTAGIFDRMSDSSAALGIAFDAVSKTTVQRFRELKAAAQVVGIQIGAAFAPLATIVAKALTGATRAISAFIERLRTADTFSAKIDVVISSVREIVGKIQDAVGRAIAQIDWDAVWNKARGIADGLQARIEEIEWSNVGRSIGDGIADAVKQAIPAVKELAERISNAAAQIDFVKLGKAMGPGLAAAVVTAFVTLLDPAFWVKNWDLALAVAAVVFGKGLGRLAGKLVGPLVKFGGDLMLKIAVGIERAAPRLASVLLRVALTIPRTIAKALSPLTGIVAGVFGRLGRVAQFAVKVLGIQAAINVVVGFGKKITGVFTQVFETLQRSAFKAVLAILEPFSHLPGVLGGGIFQDAKAAVQKRLDEMGLGAEAAAKRVQAALDKIRGSINLIASLDAKRSPTGFLNGLLGGGGAAVGGGGGGPAGGPAPGPAPAAPTGPPAWIKQWEKAAALLQLAVDKASVALDRAGRTSGLSDDIKAIQGIIGALALEEKAVRGQLALHKNNLDLQNQLVDVQRQQIGQEQALADAVRQRAANQKAAAKQATQAAQFKALGLDASGAALIPTVKNLRGRLGNISEAVKGTFLDTSKVRSLLQRIRAVLAGQFGKISEETRATIKGMLDDITGQMKGAATGPLTKFHKANAKQILKGLGLDPEQFKAAQARISQIGSSGMVGTGGAGGAFGLPVAAAGGTTFVLNNPTFTGVSDVQELQSQLQQRARRTAASRRGPNAGSNRGLA